MIPIVSNINDLEKLSEMIMKCGFCYVPIDKDKIELIKTTYNLSKEFFQQDNSVKNKYLMDKNGLGYIHKNRYSTKNNITEIKEQISLRPTEIDLGEKYNNKLNEYYKYVSSLAQKIFMNLLKQNQIKEEPYNESYNTLTLLHYKKDDESDNYLGIRQHTDWGYITVLWTDNSGLQIKIKDNSEWMDVPVLENHFIINVGDMLEVLSCGKYKSTMHRVQVKEEKYSMALFFEPSLSTIVKPKITNDGYKEVRFSQYIDKKLNESYTETYGI